jgi:hypothetical protein
LRVVIDCMKLFFLNCQGCAVCQSATSIRATRHVQTDVELSRACWHVVFVNKNWKCDDGEELRLLTNLTRMESDTHSSRGVLPTVVRPCV